MIDRKVEAAIEYEVESTSLEDTILATPPVPVLQDKDRVTISGFVHHEHYGDTPHSVSLNCSYFTETVEQPYTRRVTVTQESKQLRYGWFSENGPPVGIGLIIILNLESTIPPSVQPTDEEKENVNKRVVEMTLDHGPVFKILPGLFFMGHLTDYSDVSLRCVHETASCVIHVFPK